MKVPVEMSRASLSTSVDKKKKKQSIVKSEYILFDDKKSEDNSMVRLTSLDGYFNDLGDDESAIVQNEGKVIKKEITMIKKMVDINKLRENLFKKKDNKFIKKNEESKKIGKINTDNFCLLYTSPSPRD